MSEPLTREERRRALLLEHCDNCAGLVALSGADSWPEVEAAHDVCHGWYHCECCGGCPTCAIEGRVDVALDEWESAIQP